MVSEMQFPMTDISLQVEIPSPYRFRPLMKSDYQPFLKLLSQLTSVGNISESQFDNQFDWLVNHNDTQRTLVIENTENNQLVGSGSIIVERKFIHECGMVGHIEDIVICESTRGKKLGKCLIDQLAHIGETMGCYKVLLSCAEKNVGFYEKCGLTRKEVTMARYFIVYPSS
ncbi:N-acetyltransferase [Boothiomyces macroporosus]|uniref:Glucosamine 6-phosphate N-acetyltransferase n=1 Tax=Boothiomyces macroporosus TaxID=261099 RepID=A0AAD5Y4N7_9FUNG|nr:N-acetyltransferase [Boothiomyces macroporosus]